MDMSYSMKDNLPSVETLGLGLGMIYYLTVVKFRYIAMIVNGKANHVSS